MNIEKIVKILVNNLEKVVSDSIYAVQIEFSDGLGSYPTCYFLADFYENEVKFICDGTYSLIKVPSGYEYISKNKTYTISIDKDSDLEQIKNVLPPNITKIRYNAKNDKYIADYSMEENDDTLIIIGPTKISNKITNKQF